jgi:tetratricopeptide (TPR) repeat protein
MKVFSPTYGFAASILLLSACGALRAESADDLIQKGYAFDVQLKAAQALELYSQAEKLEPGNARILVAIARQYRHLMADAETRENKLELGRIALQYGQRAAALAPNDSDAQLSPAISYGKMLSLMSTKDRVMISRRIKDSTDRALQLDPRNDLAWHVLGRWHEGYAELAGVRRAIGELLYGKLPASTDQDAARCFEKAIEANPRRLMHYIELGRVYARMGRTADARRFLETGCAMPNVEKDDPGVKERGREALSRLR